MAEQQPPGMTIAEVAAYLPKVPRGSVHKLAQRGKIPGQKVGRHWRFRMEAVEGGSASGLHSTWNRQMVASPNDRWRLALHL